MGIDTSAVLIWGVPYEELEYDEEEYDDFYEYTEELGFDYASPYYDSDYEQRIYGVWVAWSRDYSHFDITDEITLRIEEAKKAFKEKTGLEGRLYISPHIT